MTNLDDVRKEIAIRHETLIGKDDPILMMVTIYDKVVENMIEEHVSKLNNQQEELMKKMLNSLQKSQDETKRLAKTVVNEGTEYASAVIKSTIDESRIEFKREMRNAWESIQLAKKISLIGAAVSASCLVLVVSMSWFNAV